MWRKWGAICGYPALALENCCEAVDRDAQGIGRHSKLFQLFGRISPGCTGRIPLVTFISSPLINGSPRSPHRMARCSPPEADTPLKVDPYAVLAGPITGECFKPVAGLGYQVREQG